MIIKGWKVRSLKKRKGFGNRYFRPAPEVTHITAFQCVCVFWRASGLPFGIISRVKGGYHLLLSDRLKGDFMNGGRGGEGDVNGGGDVKMCRTVAMWGPTEWGGGAAR